MYIFKHDQSSSKQHSVSRNEWILKTNIQEFSDLFTIWYLLFDSFKKKCTDLTKIAAKANRKKKEKGKQFLSKYAHVTAKQLCHYTYI